MSNLLEPVSNSDMRLDYCEFCGGTSGYYETHHIRPKGSGGPDIRANKVNLCVVDCHQAAQEYRIKPYQLIIIVARRENTSVEEVYKAIGWPVPDNIGELEKIAQEKDTSPQTIEDLISYLIIAEQGEQDSRFIRGRIIDELIKRGVKKSWIASQLGKSTAYIRTLHNTYLAFPTEETRVPSLSWSHHRIAAATDDPMHWIERAAGKDENGEETGREMSCYELRKAILENDRKTGKVPIEDDEEKAMKKAEKVLTEVDEVISLGGNAGKWLLKRLEEILEDHKVKC